MSNSKNRMPRTHISGLLVASFLAFGGTVACSAEASEQDEGQVTEQSSEAFGFHHPNRGHHPGSHHSGKHGKRHKKSRLRLLETLSVPTFSTDTAVFVSSQDYPSDQHFLIKVSGLITWGGCDPVTCPDGASCSFARLGDAQFNSDVCFEGPDPTFTSFGFPDIQLFIDGAPIPDSPFAPNHVYKFVRAGNDGPFVFNYNDCPGCYGDNAGDLTVRISSTGH